MLDNIVTDGMRVAAEVKRRMDDAQREFEKANDMGPQRHRDDEDEEEYDADMGNEAGSAERRSVREHDRDLLDGAEAEEIEPQSAVANKRVDNLMDMEHGHAGGANAGEKEGGSKVVEFER